MLRTIRCGAIVGLILGLAIALGCDVWYASEHGLGQDGPFLVAAILSAPTSMAVAVGLPHSGEARYAYWFITFVPLLNGAVVGSVIAVGSHAAVLLGRRWHARGPSPAA